MIMTTKELSALIILKVEELKSEIKKLEKVYER